MAPFVHAPPNSSTHESRAFQGLLDNLARFPLPHTSSLKQCMAFILDGNLHREANIWKIKLLRGDRKFYWPPCSMLATVVKNYTLESDNISLAPYLVIPRASAFHALLIGSSSKALKNPSLFTIVGYALFDQGLAGSF